MAKLNKESSYTLELNQKELDFLLSITGVLMGIGEVREVADDIYWTLEKHGRFVNMFERFPVVNKDFKFDSEEE